MVTAVRDTAPTTRTIRDVLLRVQGEYRDMPGLKLTEAQAQRLLGIDCDTCAVVLSTLIQRRFLRRGEASRAISVTFISENITVPRCLKAVRNRFP